MEGTELDARWGAFTTTVSSRRLPLSRPVIRSVSCSAVAQRHQRSLVLEQPALTLQPAAEAGQLPFRADHAVTGNDDGNRVGAVGGANGTGRFGIAQAPGELTITRCDTEGDLAQQLPYAELEVRPPGLERQIERGACVGEILLELGFDANEQFRRATSPEDPALGGVKGEGMNARSREIHAGQSRLRCRQHEIPHRARNRALRCRHGTKCSRDSRLFRTAPGAAVRVSTAVWMLSAVIGCSSHGPPTHRILVPPALDLKQYGTVGLVP